MGGNAQQDLFKLMAFVPVSGMHQSFAKPDHATEEVLDRAADPHLFVGLELGKVDDQIRLERFPGQEHCPAERHVPLLPSGEGDQAEILSVQIGAQGHAGGDGLCCAKGRGIANCDPAAAVKKKGAYGPYHGWVGA
jgi:hypothetical protein